MIDLTHFSDVIGNDPLEHYVETETLQHLLKNVDAIVNQEADIDEVDEDELEHQDAMHGHEEDASLPKVEILVDPFELEEKAPERDDNYFDVNQGNFGVDLVISETYGDGDDDQEDENSEDSINIDGKSSEAVETPVSDADTTKEEVAKVQNTIEDLSQDKYMTEEENGDDEIEEEEILLPASVPLPPSKPEASAEDTKTENEDDEIVIDAKDSEGVAVLSDADETEETAEEVQNVIEDLFQEQDMTDNGDKSEIEKEEILPLAAVPPSSNINLVISYQV